MEQLGSGGSDAERETKSDEEFELRPAEPDKKSKQKVAKKEKVSTKKKKRKAKAEEQDDVVEKKMKSGKKKSEAGDAQGKGTKRRAKKKLSVAPLETSEVPSAGQSAAKEKRKSVPSKESESEISDNESLDPTENDSTGEYGKENTLEEETVDFEERTTEKAVSSKSLKEENNTNSAKGVRVDPKKIFRIEDYGPKVHLPDDFSELHNEQRINIQQAFANDDVIEEFTSEKAEVEEASKPKDVDLTLPGWGSWAGAGLKVSEKKKKKFLVPAPPAPPRKDRELAHVIIHEERDKRFARNQVCVPSIILFYKGDYTLWLKHPHRN